MGDGLEILSSYAHLEFKPKSSKTYTTVPAEYSNKVIYQRKKASRKVDIKMPNLAKLTLKTKLVFT